MSIEIAFLPDRPPAECYVHKKVATRGIVTVYNYCYTTTSTDRMSYTVNRQPARLYLTNQTESTQENT